MLLRHSVDLAWAVQDEAGQQAILDVWQRGILTFCAKVAKLEFENVKKYTRSIVRTTIRVKSVRMGQVRTRNLRMEEGSTREGVSKMASCCWRHTISSMASGRILCSYYVEMRQQVSAIGKALSTYRDASGKLRSRRPKTSDWANIASLSVDFSLSKSTQFFAVAMGESTS